MKHTIKNWLKFSTLVLVTMLSINFSAVAQTDDDDDDMSGGALAVLLLAVGSSTFEFDAPNQLVAPNGQTKVGTYLATKEQLIVEAKDGKLVKFGLKPASGGRFKALSPTATPCMTTSCTTENPPRCFLVHGTCICLCGPWIRSTGKN